MIRTSITELFGIKYPIIQGGMQHVSLPKLVAAVSNAGGLGVLTCSNYQTKEELVSAIHVVRTLTDKPFGLNIATAAPLESLERNMEVAISEKVSVVETSGSKPHIVIGPLKAAGIKVFHKIPHARFAKKLEQLGYDAIAIVGHEAGGHPGPFGVTSEIVLMEVLDTVDIPVIMGGGVYDGRGLMASLAYGADGILMGTRFLASSEAEIHESIKQWIVKSQTTDTLLVKSDNPNRVAKSQASYGLLGMEKCDKTLNDILKCMMTMKERNSWTSGDMTTHLQSMGQVCGVIKDIRPVAEILDSIVAQATDLMNNKLKNQIG